MKKHYRHENNCLNCGTILEGKFCHNCGQENLEMKESFGHMVTHAVSDYFHFDDQFFSTLKPLFFSPGKLTNEYLLGRRAHYLHPVKMYIFISLIFFVLAFRGGKHNPIQVNPDAGKHSKTEQKQIADSTRKSINDGINSNEDLSASQKKALADKITAYLPDAASKEMQANIKKDSVKKAEAKNNESEESDFNILTSDEKGKNYEEYLAAQKKLPADKQDGIVEKYIIKKSFDWKNQGKSAQEIFYEGFKHNVPKMMFILLPLFALILYIAFRKNRKFYVEHIIYAIHLHCFIFLFLICTFLLEMILPAGLHSIMDIVGLITTIAFIWYVYRSFRVVYNRSRWRTVSKMIGVSFMYLLATIFCFFVFIVITAVTSV